MRSVACSLGVLILTACGSGGDDLGNGGAGGSVTAISGPLLGRVATVFVVHGTGFGPAGSTAQVRLTATGGETPFLGSASATVSVDVLSTTTAMGIAPEAVPIAFSAALELLPAAGGVLGGPGVAAFYEARLAILPGPNDDHLVGTAGGDTLDGGVGNDSLFGGEGNDVLTGGTGHDKLYGEGGNDTLTGGPQPDGFYVAPGTEADTIVDYDAGVDFLVLSGAPATRASFALISSVGDAGLGGDVVVHWAAGGTLTLQGYGIGSIDTLDALVDAGIRMLLDP